MEDLSFEKNLKRDGFTSSNEKRPPFKTLVDVYSPHGKIVQAMYHENENDGYDFDLEVKERRMCLHYISDFSTEKWWRVHRP